MDDRIELDGCVVGLRDGHAIIRQQDIGHQCVADEFAEEIKAHPDVEMLILKVISRSYEKGWNDAKKDKS